MGSGGAEGKSLSLVHPAAETQDHCGNLLVPPVEIHSKAAIKKESYRLLLFPLQRSETLSSLKIDTVYRDTGVLLEGKKKESALDISRS